MIVGTGDVAGRMKGLLKMGYGYSSGGSGFVALLLIAIPICYLMAWALTMGIVTQAAKEKGYDDLTGKLWFIGLFGLIFTPAIIVAALPDKKLQASSSKSADAATVATDFDELPDL